METSELVILRPNTRENLIFRTFPRSNLMNTFRWSILIGWAWETFGLDLESTNIKVWEGGCQLVMCLGSTEQSLRFSTAQEWTRYNSAPKEKYNNTCLVWLKFLCGVKSYTFPAAKGSYTFAHV